MIVPAVAGAKGFPMKAVVAICVAVTALWLADIELNDGRYGDATGRTIMSLIGKYDRLSLQRCHESYDTLVPRLRGANERTWSRFPVRAMPPNHHLLRGVGCLALSCSGARASSLASRAAASLNFTLRLHCGEELSAHRAC
jgi:hypothetical protein